MRAHLPSPYQIRFQPQALTPVSRCAELFDFVEVSWQPAKGVRSAAQYALVADFPKRTFSRDTVAASGVTFLDEAMGPQQAFFIQWD